MNIYFEVHYERRKLNATFKKIKTNSCSQQYTSEVEMWDRYR